MEGEKLQNSLLIPQGYRNWEGRNQSEIYFKCSYIVGSCKFFTVFAIVKSCLKQTVTFRT